MTLARMNHPFSPVFNSLWNDFLEGDREIKKGNGYNFSTPKVNIVETVEEFRIELAAPGLKKENFELKVEKDLLWIKGIQGKEAEATEGKYSKREFAFGVFERRFRLPETINTEGIEANYENGILTVSLPKLEDQVNTPRKIEIQ